MSPQLSCIFYNFWILISRADSKFAPKQWETSLQSNVVSHWLGANLQSALDMVTQGARAWAGMILTYFSSNILVSVSKGLISLCEIDKLTILWNLRMKWLISWLNKTWKDVIKLFPFGFVVREIIMKLRISPLVTYNYLMGFNNPFSGNVHFENDVHCENDIHLKKECHEWFHSKRSCKTKDKFWKKQLQ